MLANLHYLVALSSLTFRDLNRLESFFSGTLTEPSFYDNIGNRRGNYFDIGERISPVNFRIPHLNRRCMYSSKPSR